MLDPRFVILGALLNIIGSASYLMATIKGEVKPNRVTWALWALAPLLAFAAEVKQGVGIQSLVTFIAGFDPLIIFIVSFVNKKAKWKLGKIDIACGLLSLLGLLLWYITKVGNVAIIFAILADGLAGLPTLIKSWKFPETEEYKVFLLAGISALITLLTIKEWTLAYYGFPLYLAIICGVLFIFIKFKIGKMFRA